MLKRVVMDYMKFPDEVMDGVASPVRTYVALHSMGCTTMSAILAFPDGPAKFIRRLPSEGWTALIVGMILATVGGIVLAELLSKGNPGTTMVYLNAGTNIMTYVAGAVLYGNLTWQGTAGVLLVASGISLIKGS